MYSSGNLLIPPWEKDMLVIGRVVEASWNKHVISMVITAVLLFQGKIGPKVMINFLFLHLEGLLYVPWGLSTNSIDWGFWRGEVQHQMLKHRLNLNMTIHSPSTANMLVNKSCSIPGWIQVTDTVDFIYVDTVYLYIYISWRNRSSPLTLILGGILQPPSTTGIMSGG